MTKITRQPRRDGITVTIKAFVPTGPLTDTERNGKINSAIAQATEQVFGPLLELAEIEDFALRQDKRSAEKEGE